MRAVTRGPAARGFTAAWPGLPGAPSLAGRPARLAGRGSLKPGRATCSAPQDLGFVLGEVDDRGRLGAAVAGVDHRVHGVADLVGDLPALAQGLVLVRQQEGARNERL